MIAIISFQYILCPQNIVPFEIHYGHIIDKFPAWSSPFSKLSGPNKHPRINELGNHDDAQIVPLQKLDPKVIF